MKSFIGCLFAAVVALLADGCASPNVNPSIAKADTGYVDFYTGGTNDLYWDVTDVKSNLTVFSQFKPLGEPILRLAFKPGTYKFQVTFLNRVIDTPGITNVDVRDGMVTPVLVTLTPSGTSVVQSQRMQSGGTFHGSWGVRVRSTHNNTTNYDISVEPQTALPYQPREYMLYTSDSHP